MNIQLQQNRLMLDFDPETGAIRSTNADGLVSPDVRGKSGMMLRDAVTGIHHPVHLPLLKTETGFVQKGEVDGIQTQVSYQVTDRGLYVDGELRKDTEDDRLLSMEFRVPVQADGLRWLDDAEESRPIQSSKYFSNATEMVCGQQDQTVSFYPFGGISDGSHALALGVPMDPPSSFEIGYEAWNSVGYLMVTVRMVLTPKTVRLSNVGHFSFVLYLPEEPAWGFRSITKGYYDRYPQFFVRRAEGGNWLFQHPYADLEHLEDFHLRYNETPDPAKTDVEHGICPLRYTAPGEVWMWWKERPKDPHPTYEEFMERFEELKHCDPTIPSEDFFNVTMRQFAEAVSNSAIHRKNHEYLTMGWHAYGPTVAFISNHSPNIPGWNMHKLQMCQVKGSEEQAAADGVSMGGVYIDNMSWGYDGQYNYRRDHFAYSDYTLLWDDGRELVWPNAFAQYEYAKSIRDYVQKDDHVILANSVFPEKGAVHYVHLLDVPGSEVGPHWGHDAWINRLRRTLAYQKPWDLLLTNDPPYMGETPDLHGCKEQIMKESVLYGLFSNIWGYRPPKETYNEDRPLFKKYLPAVVKSDQLGWQPVTYCKADARGLLMERFGDFSAGEAMFTVMNTEKEAVQTALLADRAALGLTDSQAKALRAVDLITGEELPVALKNDSLEIALRLQGGDVAALLLTEQKN